MCSDLMPRLRALKQSAFEQHGADAMALPGLLDAEGGFPLAREHAAERTQFGGAAQDAVDEEAVHNHADFGCGGGMVSDEFVRHRRRKSADGGSPGSRRSR